MKNPCKNCESRHIGCHGTCTEYGQFRACVDSINAQQEYERMHSTSVQEILERGFQRRQKRKRRRY